MSSSGSQELQCVGKLEIVKPKPVGFLCGSIPVPTDKAFHAVNSALVPSTQTVRAPRYRVLPNETDLNTPPHLSSIPEKVLPTVLAHSRTGGGDLPWESGAITSNLTRKGEALAVSGFVEYGDEIDVIAPADILKQIFKIPYSKARLSIAVHRIGQTLVLNTGPDIEEGEKMVRRHASQSKCADQSLFLNFAMHSVRMEACDCPPGHHSSPEEKSKTSVLPELFESRDVSFEPAKHQVQGNASQSFGQNDDIPQQERFSPEYPQVKKDNFFWASNSSKKNKGRHAVKKTSQVKEKPRCSMQESEHRRAGNDGFLRVLFWQFHNFRMLLGSDLLLLSNEKYVAVSLHLWDVSLQVTPLTWLEAWLDNVMAGVPELAICYHQDGVVQGYELLKTDDIFLLKGVSEDGLPAFHPHVVQQNGLSVLRFLQENCKQDPGAYWLYKSAGEDVMQLFDLSVLPKKHASNDCHDSSISLPSLINRGRSDSLLSLGTLLYRIAHRLSLSMHSPNSRARCARFFKKCLDFLDEPDHLVVRACAHEQFARFLLTYDDELDLTPEAFPVDSGVTLDDAEEESFDLFSNSSESIVRALVCSPVAEDEPLNEDETYQNLGSEASLKMTIETNVSTSKTLIASGETELKSHGDKPNSNDRNIAVCELPEISASVVQTVADPISSKLAAIHHVSQAIKSLRWKRQLQGSDSELGDDTRTQDGQPSSIDFSCCACGDVDCIEVSDIGAWLPTPELDNKLWKLVLLLGESYLALGQAYKDNKQLHKALKIVQLASMVYGSMPQHLEKTRFISSMVCCLPQQMEMNDQTENDSIIGNATKMNSISTDNCVTSEQFHSTYLFWAKAWTLVGDAYVEFHLIHGKENSSGAERKPLTRELRMSSEVLKEVKRLKRKLGQVNQNCSSCSLVNCSCKSDRASSGSSASSSNGDVRPLSYGRKQGRRSNAKSRPYSISRKPEENTHILESEKDSERELVEDGMNINDVKEGSNMMENFQEENILEAINTKRAVSPVEMGNMGSALEAETETASGDTTEVKNGGIFKYLGGPVVGDAEYNLLAALSCYEEAVKSLGGLPRGSVEIQSILRKKGWVCNELGRMRLERNELNKAELAFVDAIHSFREVSDHTNIILIYCNLGHCRRALAEEMVSKIKTLKTHEVFWNAYNKTLETAKLEYSESLRYYGAAKLEINAIAGETLSMPNSLRNEAYTQFAHTYLRLGMLLAEEDTIAQVYENQSLEITASDVRKAKKEFRKHEVSANDAIREALSVYESLGELRKQEAAYAYFQLACYQRDCCLKFLKADQKKSNLPKGENSILQRMKQYASLAERNWQKSMDFYGPVTHPLMHLTILMERSALSLSLSALLHPNAMLESALCHLLEVRHVSSGSLKNENPEMYAKFWSQLQMILKRMLAMTLSTRTGKSQHSFQQSVVSSSSRWSGEVGKLRELYKMSLKFTELGQLHAMHQLWTSS